MADPFYLDIQRRAKNTTANEDEFHRGIGFMTDFLPEKNSGPNEGSDHLSLDLPESISRLFQDPKLSKVGADYLKRKRFHFSMGFNVFEIISEAFHRENFHSDVLAAFLDVNGKHGQGTTYLDTFIELLTKVGGPELNVSPADFARAQVFREKGRIDIAIFGEGESGKKAIIIENKINGAVDRPRQLPKYLDYAQQLGYEVAAIVYLPLDEQKSPNKESWSNDDLDRVGKLFIKVPGYKGGPDDLLNGWIRPCEKETDDDDAKLLLRQYGNLIEHLGAQVMDKRILGEFFELIGEKDNLQTALTVKGMLDELPNFIASEFREKMAELEQMDSVPVTRGAYNNGVAWTDGWVLRESFLGVSVSCTLESIEVKFYDAHKKMNVKVLVPEDIRTEMTEEEGSLRKAFDFPKSNEELSEAIAFMESLIRSLKSNREA